MMQESIYLATIGTVAQFLSIFSLNNQWQAWTRRRLAVDRSPMWAAELYQLVALAIGLVTLAGLRLQIQTNQVCRSLILILAVYRLFEIPTFALQWLFVDRRPVKNFRRSLLQFSLNLVEVALFAALAVLALLGYSAEGRWTLFYELARSVFTLSVPSGIETSLGLATLLHVVMFEAWLLTLMVLAAVINGVTREELDVNKPAPKQTASCECQIR